MLKPRKRLVKAKLKEDKLLVFTAKAQRYIRQNRRSITFATVGVLVVVCGFAVYNWSQRAEAAEAALDELLMRDAYARGELDSVLVRADRILDDYPRTSSAAAALMLKGRVHESRGEYEEAIETYERLLRKHSGEKYLAFGACYALGTIYLGKDDLEQAADFYLKAANDYPDHFNAPNALLEAGKCLEKLSRYEQAKRAYHKIIAEYPKSRTVNRARQRLTGIEFMR